MTDNNFDFSTPVERRGTDSVKWDEWPDKEVLPLWVADMDFRTAPAITDALVRRAQHGIFGYTHPGVDYFDSIVSWFSRRHCWDIDPSSIIYTTGVVPALSATIKAFTRPGDAVVIMTPVYTCFYSSIRNNGCIAVESPLVMDGDRYIIDFENLDKCLSEPRVRALVLCNPHNPGGRAWTRDELMRVAALAERHGVTVVSDEIHCEIVMPGYNYTPYATVAGKPSVSLISPSKAFNTAGLQTANIVAGSEELRLRIDRAINDNETCDIGPFGVTALIAAYRHGEPWLDAMINYVHNNYLYLRKEIDGMRGVRVLSLEATYLAWLDVSSLGIEVGRLCDDMRDNAKIWFHPGTMYGHDGEGYIRINLATSRTTLAEAVRRFANYINSL